MSATRSYTICCEYCEEWEEIDNCNSAAAARRELKEKGWSSKRVDGGVFDQCPQCTQVTQMYKRRKR